MPHPSLNNPAFGNDIYGSELEAEFVHKKVCIETKKCRICGSTELTSVADLGSQNIASIFVKGSIPDLLQKKYPLELVRCTGKDGCGLVQLRHSVSPDVLYYDYGYRSGINESMRKNLAEIVADIEKMVALKPGDTIVDIGCNDGTLLSFYKESKLDKLGIDPATNVIKLARECGIEVVNDFFSAKAYHGARPERKARVVTSIAMFYDLERPMDFVKDIASILADDGVWVIELSYMPTMLEQNSYDTICHEHLEYYTLRQIEWMVSRHGMSVHKVVFNDVNGGSFRLFIRKNNCPCAPDAELTKLQQVRDAETQLKLDTEIPYDHFRKIIEKNKNDLKNLLADLRKKGKTVYLYGASTKGNTILQYVEINQDLVHKAAERNRDKWGRRTLGTDIPIVSEDQARSEKPDYFLVLPWHFFEGFKTREIEFLKNGGKFILPLPEVKVVGIEDL